MKQVWNIFRKDARHHWPEIVASVALLAVYAWKDTYDWNHSDKLSIHILTELWSPSLVPLFWLFLLTRGIQGESLVGNRQFWVTRPYDWRKLASAKILFTLTFINLPLFAMQVSLLAIAGFRPMAYLPQLLWIQVLWILALFVGIAALAAVTANLVQMLLAIFLLVLYVICIATLMEVISKPNSPSLDWRLGILILGTFVAVLFLQYSRRKTIVSRSLIIGLFGLLGLVPWLTPKQTFDVEEYPLAHDPFPARFSLLPRQPPKQSNSAPYNDTVVMRFPLSAVGVTSGSFLEVNEILVTLTNALGLRWDSDWLSQAALYFPDQNSAEVSFQLKRKLFDRFKTGPVNAHVVVAFTHYADRDTLQFVVPGNRFFLPSLATCLVPEKPYWGQLKCRVPPRRPTVVLISSKFDASTCPQSSEYLPGRASLVGHTLLRFGTFVPSIIPFTDLGIYLSGSDESGNSYSHPGICPGTPLALSHPAEIGRNRVEVDFENLSLAEYEAGTRKQ